ncbi:MAG: PTS ascorbate transporter subunit IIB, partial [Erysipelotrichaceae bacterium]|nr:PTS ascorbate transporter subunit IIB [Erysipelotrichaceae bacterium]
MALRKILCVCGSGLGSSFLVEMNVSKVLKKLGL